MERKVGKPKLKTALLYALCVLWFAWFLFSADAWPLMRVAAVILVIIVIGIVIPGIVYCQVMWKVDNEKLYYTYYRTFFSKIRGFYTFLYHRKHVYQIVLNLEQIDFIHVTYQKVERAPYGGYGYDLLFEVHMFDGSIYIFESLVTRNRQSFCEAISFMKEKGIVFKDSLKILDYLYSGEYLSYYLEKVEDKHND